MIIEAIVLSVAAIVLGGTWMGLRFAKEYDPELRKIREERSKVASGVKARKKAYEAIGNSCLYPYTSRETVITQIQVFPQAFSQE